jgi:ribosome-associated protein
MIQITPSLALGDDEVVVEFVRAAGPGGQNVNKVATAVQLRFDVANSPSLPDDVRQRLRRLAGSRITADGILILNAKRWRTQQQNRAEAFAQLSELIRRATIRPKNRLKSKPSAAARAERLTRKRQRSTLKQNRRRVSGDE